ncbi:hypothetical protein LNV08_19085 [Paucibacter sp. TC2R-5]|uniref:hypothetical protein n=1 Tax=Paucibacter sp. TC2R-5 TaxID=2893555 RepID=UPI0021E4933D|nr:hypothetical protein [Paucibacter sp. TC2R-5]MCV2361086.1 hypothetical protein [Paucibacter sp. TC2R-5]
MNFRAPALPGLVVAVSLLCSGCASWVAPPDVLSPHPIVNLPISAAGVKDERQAFATLFEQELQAHPGPKPQAIAAWLHGIEEQYDKKPADLDAIKRRFAEQAPGTAVLLVPGLFADCFEDQSVPFGDGLVREPALNRSEAYRQYADLGLAGIRSIAVAGRESSEANALRVAEAIKQEAARPEVKRIVLLAYSKGVPDSLRALTLLQSQPQGLPAALSDLISVAGVVMGTRLADHFEGMFESLSTRIDPFGCSASDGREVSSVTQRESVAWLVAHPPPAELRYHSVVGFAQSTEIGISLRPFNAALNNIDPRNDGQLLSRDAILPGSSLLAEARADHWDIALPRERHPSSLMRASTSERGYPRETLFRSLVKWVLAAEPGPHSPR